MKVIVTSQSTSWAAWQASGGTETLSAGFIDEQELDEDFFDWLRRSGSEWTITATTEDDSIVISHWNEVGIERQRTTIDCDRSDHDEALRRLKVLKASFQQRERERAGSNLLAAS